MIKRVSCVFRLLDSVRGTPLTATQADFLLDGEPCKPVYKAGGYFVLIDLPEGEHRIGIRSALFQPDEFGVRISYEKPFDERRDVITVRMNPSPLHPAARTGVSVSGRLASGGSAVFYIARHTVGFKIAEDHAAAGNDQIKLFSQSTAVSLPSVCLVNDKDMKKAEFVEVISASGDVYCLAAPLCYAHKRSTELIPMIRYRCGEGGEFFIKLPSGYGAKDASGQIALTLFVETEDGLAVREIFVSPKGETHVGTV